MTELKEWIITYHLKKQLHIISENNASQSKLLKKNKNENNNNNNNNKNKQ